MSEKQGAATDGTDKTHVCNVCPWGGKKLIRADKTSFHFKNPTCCSINLGNSHSFYRHHLNHKTIIRATHTEWRTRPTDTENIKITQSNGSQIVIIHYSSLYIKATSPAGWGGAEDRGAVAATFSGAIQTERKRSINDLNGASQTCTRPACLLLASRVNRFAH